MLRPRRCRALCSPSTQRSASTMFDLPQPLGPTMPGDPARELQHRPVLGGLEACKLEPLDPHRHPLLQPAAATGRTDGEYPTAEKRVKTRNTHRASAEDSQDPARHTAAGRSVGVQLDVPVRPVDRPEEGHPLPVAADAELLLRRTGVQAGRRGLRISRIPAAAGCPPPLRRLHSMHAHTTFSQVVRPPRQRGTTWSRLSSLRAKRPRAVLAGVRVAHEDVVAAEANLAAAARGRRTPAESPAEYARALDQPHRLEPPSVDSSRPVRKSKVRYSSSTALATPRYSSERARRTVVTWTGKKARLRTRLRPKRRRRAAAVTIAARLPPRRRAVKVESPAFRH